MVGGIGWISVPSSCSILYRLNLFNISKLFPTEARDDPPVFPVDEVDRKSKMSKSTRATNAMKVCFRVFREIEVDNDIYSLNINTTSEEIRAYEITANTIPKVVEDTIAVILEHFRVRVET